MLFDSTLERLVVAAFMADPARLIAFPDLACSDFGDLQALEVFTAIRNVEAARVVPDVEAVRAELQAMHDRRGPHRAGEERRDLDWFERIASQSIDHDAPVAGWVNSITDLAFARTAITASDEPPPPEPRQATGPRAKNEEPLRLADAFGAYAYSREGHLTLVRWARAWWRYDGVRYVEHDDEALDRDVMRFLDVVRVPRRSKNDGKVTWERVTSKRKTISELRLALLSTMPSVASDSPHWATPGEGDPDPETLVACQNGILNLRTRELLPRTPRLFTTAAICADWDPAAECPAWLAFLSSVWGEDTESIRALQQLFGYLLTPDTSYQKLFALIGPARSGKGTIGRILRALLGDVVVNPTLASLEETFGLAPLVGKTVAIIGDARLGGQQDQAQVVERLLSISGEDLLSINRKNRDAINVRLRTRVLLLSNELPRLVDASGAIASRFQVLTMTRSFLGSEDIGLEQRLAGELAGIFRWAVEGYEDLREAGQFLQPLASEQARQHLADNSSSVRAFVDDCCRIREGAEADKKSIYDRYKDWCKEGGYEHPRNREWFARDLYTICPDITVADRRERMFGKRWWVFVGIEVL